MGLAPHFPGRGPSSDRRAVLDNGWTFELLNRTLLALLEELGAGPAHLVGISVGGLIVQSFVLAHPSRVAGLTLIATGSEFPDAARAAMRERATRLRAVGVAVVIEETMKRWFTPDTLRERPDLIDRATKTLLADDAETHARSGRRSARRHGDHHGWR